MELDLLKRIVNSRMRCSYKTESRSAAFFFNKWIKFYGIKCTNNGARKMITKHKDKFNDLLPGKSHKSYNKWMEEVNQLNLNK